MKKCVLVLYYRRITPDLLQEWSETMVDHCGTAQELLFFVDGKPWRTCRLGAGKAAHEVMRQVGHGNVNFVQMSHYNGHCGMHGLEVSSVLQADGVRHAHSESLRRHDSK